MTIVNHFTATMLLAGLLGGCASDSEKAQQIINECHFESGANAPQWYCDQYITTPEAMRFELVSIELNSDLPRHKNEDRLFARGRNKLAEQVRVNLNNESTSISHTHIDGGYSGYREDSTSTERAEVHIHLVGVKLYRSVVDDSNNFWGLVGIPEKSFKQAQYLANQQYLNQ